VYDIAARRVVRRPSIRGVRAVPVRRGVRAVRVVVANITGDQRIERIGAAHDVQVAQDEHRRAGTKRDSAAFLHRVPHPCDDGIGLLLALEVVLVPAAALVVVVEDVQVARRAVTGQVDERHAQVSLARRLGCLRLQPQGPLAHDHAVRPLVGIPLPVLEREDRRDEIARLLGAAPDLLQADDVRIHGTEHAGHRGGAVRILVRETHVPFDIVGNQANGLGRALQERRLPRLGDGRGSNSQRRDREGGKSIHRLCSILSDARGELSDRQSPVPHRECMHASRIADGKGGQFRALINSQRMLSAPLADTLGRGIAARDATTRGVAHRIGYRTRAGSCTRLDG
jgi:hypothetical protein